ncbi:MAG TPA: argininosuccinate lyase [Actinomycetota bacterium]|nr:argininosuccinate lyase [Actinomycetota bacterium]
MTRLWGGRFGDEPAPELLAFTESLSFDRLLVYEDCAVLAAHARSLARAGIISADDAAAVAAALDGIARDIASDTFTFEPGDEDVHTAVERALLERAPEIGPRVRAGLSRNDRVVTALRLWLLRHGRSVALAVSDLIDALMERAREHPDALVPGYTHLQRAQPVRLAHHLLAHAFAFERDVRRMLDALGRTDVSSLGAGALAGSTLDLDAQTSARDLGFGFAAANSIDAVADRDFVAEFCAALAIAGVHASRLGDEIVLWTSAEFGFAELADPFATGSSLMPQKKNPDVAELARGKAGRLIGNLAGLLATLKGLPLAYNRDLQEDKEPLFDGVATMLTMVPALAATVRTLRFDTEAMARAAADDMLLATDLAERLVAGGIPFRDAHETVGRLVAEAVQTGSTLREVARASIGPDAAAGLDARTSVDSRDAPGPSASSVEAQLSHLDASLKQIRDALG